MGDYTVVDKKVDQSSQQTSQENGSNQSRIDDTTQQKQGTVATEQQLPQTGSNSYMPQIIFGGSLMLLLLAIAFKLGTMFHGSEA